MLFAPGTCDMKGSAGERKRPRRPVACAHARSPACMHACVRNNHFDLFFILQLSHSMRPATLPVPGRALHAARFAKKIYKCVCARISERRLHTFRVLGREALQSPTFWVVVRARQVAAELSVYGDIREHRRRKRFMRGPKMASTSGRQLRRAGSHTTP